MKASSAANYNSFRKPQEQSFIMKVTFAILTLFLFYKVICGNSISILAKSTDAAKCNDKHAYGNGEGKIQRYYYDKGFEKCNLFIWSGEGEENGFQVIYATMTP